MKSFPTIVYTANVSSTLQPVTKVKNLQVLANMAIGCGQINQEGDGSIPKIKIEKRLRPMEGNHRIACQWRQGKEDRAMSLGFPRQDHFRLTQRAGLTASREKKFL